MFNLLFNKRKLKKYQKVFNPDKVQTLYKEFKTQISSQLKKAAKTKDQEELRLIFHSLKSSSQVFGMEKLSKLSGKLEQKILDKKEILAKDLDDCTILYNKSIAKVDLYLNKIQP